MTQPHSPSSAQPSRDDTSPSRSKRDEGGARLSELGFSSQEISDLVKRGEGRWRPGLADQPLHSEIFASADDASGVGFALEIANDALRMGFMNESTPLAEVEDRRQVLWVQEKRAVERSGRPFLPGLPAKLRDRLIHVEAATPEDALFALEEGLKCRDLACVIGEIVGNPRALDFTASRRLSLMAEKHGVALWLVRLEAQADLSSARMRWRVESSPSARPRWNRDAPGPPQWKAELFRASRHAPGKWTLHNDQGTLSIARPKTARAKTTKPAPRRPTLPRAALSKPANTPDIGHLVRPTVGRSLAAFARV